MPLSALVYFYGRRLRTHPVQELLAGVGIAVGVALVFAVQVANSSVTSASSEAVRSVVGVATLQLRSRSADGFDAGVTQRVRALPGVLAAAPVLDLAGSVRGPNGREATVQLLSGDASLAVLAGVSARSSVRAAAGRGVLLPRATAQALGVTGRLAAGIPGAAPMISLRVRGRSTPVPVGAVLGPEIAGPLANALAVIAPLPVLQLVGTLPERVSGVLVEPRRGRQAQVRSELQRLAGGRLEVVATNDDERLLRQANAPDGKATGFFAFVSSLVGLLLAFNAMLLSTPERRRVIADLRIQGMRPRDLVKLLLFQSVCLGLIASAAGLLAGDLLARGLFHETPGYLAAAFPLGTQTVIGWRPVLLAVFGGVAATCLAAAPPLLDLRRSRAIDAVYFENGEPGHATSPQIKLRLLAAAAALLALSVLAGSLLGGAADVAAIVGVALGALLAIPACFAGVVRLAELAAARIRGLNLLLVATRTLRATSARSLALAGTGAIAVFGAVAAEGARTNLLDGLYRDYAEYVSTASLWVANPRDDLATDSFRIPELAARVAAVPGVAAVREYQGGFLDVAGHRAWVIARSPRARQMFPASQIVSGEASLAQARLRAGGWVVLSRQLADALHARLGRPVVLPTPSGPVPYRLAATTSNLGWSAGAIAMSLADHRRAWGSSDPTALEVDTRPRASLAATRRAIGGVLGPESSLRVQTAAGRAAEADALAREGLSRLSQIVLLLIAAAALAMAAAMGASIWQRRPSLASLRIQTFSPAQLRVILLAESALVLATGCLAGAAAGLYGHALIDRYLRLVSGFPAPYAIGLPQAAATVAAIVGAALLVLAVPGYVASRVPPALALQDPA